MHTGALAWGHSTTGITVVTFVDALASVLLVACACGGPGALCTCWVLRAVAIGVGRAKGGAKGSVPRLVQFCCRVRRCNSRTSAQCLNGEKAVLLPGLAKCRGGGGQEAHSQRLRIRAHTLASMCNAPPLICISYSTCAQRLGGCQHRYSRGETDSKRHGIQTKSMKECDTGSSVACAWHGVCPLVCTSPLPQHSTCAGAHTRAQHLHTHNNPLLPGTPPQQQPP